MVRKRKLSNPAKLLGFESFCFSDPRPWSWILSNDGKSDLNLKYKGQRWDFCEEFTALHFATRCAAVKFVKREGWATSTLNREIPATIIRPKWPECPRKDWLGTSCWLHLMEKRLEFDHGPDGLITFPTWLGTFLVWSHTLQSNYQELLRSVRYFDSS